jgi:basic membrane lipoprotein Med (substrate-binding protein (PBP1-ABC) superfamily)
VLGLKEKGVNYVNNEMLQKNVPSGVIDKIEAVKADIISGKMSAKSYFDFGSEAEYADYVNAVSP